MTGMSRTLGTAIDGDDHLAQSVADILLTPIGSRVMRRDYGSLLPQLLDQPLNDATRLALFAATATALRRWEKRLRLVRCALEKTGAGAATLFLEGYRTDSPEPNSLMRLTAPLPRLNQAA